MGMLKQRWAKGRVLEFAKISIFGGPKSLTKQKSLTKSISERGLLKRSTVPVTHSCCMKSSNCETEKDVSSAEQVPWLPRCDSEVAGDLRTSRLQSTLAELA